MKNCDGTTTKKRTSSGNTNAGMSCKCCHNPIAINEEFFTLDYLIGLNSSGGRKTKNPKNIMLPPMQPVQHSSPQSASPTQSNHNNISPVSYSAQVSSPLTTFVPASGTISHDFSTYINC